MTNLTGKPINRRAAITAGGTALLAPAVASSAAVQGTTGQGTTAQPGTSGSAVLTPQQYLEPTDPDFQNAFERMIAAARQLAGGPDSNYNPQAPRIVIPTVDYKYLLHATLHWQGAGFDVEGFSKGHPTQAGSILKWTTDVTGMVWHTHASVGETGAGARDFNAGGSRIRGLLLEGSPRTFGAASGMLFRTAVRIEDCSANGFSGHGFQWEANEGHSRIGNTNHSQADRLAALHNWNCGFYTAGDNANGMLLRGLNAESNGRWGICDVSTVGNLYEGGHLSSNGFYRPDSRTTSVVWHRSAQGGRFYHAVPGVPPATLAATEPGTNAGVWGYLRDSSGPSATYPAWVRGGGGTTYVEGGAEKLQNAGHVHDFPYNEGGLMAIYSPAKLRNGTIKDLIDAPGVIAEFTAQGQNLFTAPVGTSMRQGARTLTALTGGNVGDSRTRTLSDSADPATTWIERLAAGVLSLARGPARVWQILTDGGFHPSLLYVGTLDGNSKARLFRTSAVPDAATGSQGDIAIALSFAPGQPYMWGKQGDRWIVLATAP